VPSQYPIVINGNVVNIGMMGTGYFNGSIDEVRIYNRSLSASEALEQYYSNLNKYAIDGWLFITNQSNLTIGTYTYYGYANNTGSLSNTIDTRALYITNPQMAFVSPTPANNAAINMTYAIINISFNESNLKNFTFTWNNSNYSIYDSALVLMFNFDNVSVLGEARIMSQMINLFMEIMVLVLICLIIVIILQENMVMRYYLMVLSRLLMLQ